MRVLILDDTGNTLAEAHRGDTVKACAAEVAAELRLEAVLNVERDPARASGCCRAARKIDAAARAAERRGR